MRKITRVDRSDSWSLSEHRWNWHSCSHVWHIGAGCWSADEKHFTITQIYSALMHPAAVKQFKGLSLTKDNVCSRQWIFWFLGVLWGFLPMAFGKYPCSILCVDGYIACLLILTLLRSCVHTDYTHTHSHLCIVGVVRFTLHTVDITSRHSCTQPFKVQLLLSADENQKQTRIPGPPLPHRTSWFPGQSITALPHLRSGSPTMLCSLRRGRRRSPSMLRSQPRKIVNIQRNCGSSVVSPAPRIPHYQLEIKIYLTSDLFGLIPD